MSRVTSTLFQPWVCSASGDMSCTAQSSADQAQTVSRRVEKFAELMQSVWVSRNDYERRVRAVRCRRRRCSDTQILSLQLSCSMLSRRPKQDGPQSNLRVPTLMPWIIRSNSQPTNKRSRGIGSPRSRTSRLYSATSKPSCGHTD